MTYLYDTRTQKYDVHITIPSFGIKEPQTKHVGTFDTEIEAIAGTKVAKNMLLIMQPVRKIPSNRDINKWIQFQLQNN